MAQADATRSDSAHIPALTGIRAIAAYLVYLHHTPLQKSVPVIKELHMGVALFFVLSGFLIAYKYEDACQWNASWLRQYFQNRFARIMPVYLLLTVATLLILGERSWTTWLLNLTLLKGFTPYYHLSGVSQAWSLTVEECFYATAPLIFLFARKSLLLPLFVLWGILGGILLLEPHYATHDARVAMRAFPLVYTFPGRCFEFFVGIYLARRIKANRDRPATPARLPLCTIGGLAGIALALAAMMKLQRSWALYGIYHPLGTATNNLLLPIAIALLYYGLIRERSLLGRLLSTRLMQLLGKSSYAFYLIHMGVATWYMTLVVYWGAQRLFGQVTAAWVLQILAYDPGKFVFLNLVAIAIYLWIETPLHNWIRRIGVRPARSAVRPGPVAFPAAVAVRKAA